MPRERASYNEVPSSPTTSSDIFDFSSTSLRLTGRKVKMLSGSEIRGTRAVNCLSLEGEAWREKPIRTGLSILNLVLGEKLDLSSCRRLGVA